MSTEDRYSRDATCALRSSTRPEAETTVAATDAGEPIPHLVEVEELIRGVFAGPAQKVDPEIVALLRGARKMHKNFLISLALRALRLEQGLRAAQQQIIRLQWELAQLRLRGASSFSSQAEDY
jgi:hypothetical protein